MKLLKFPKPEVHDFGAGKFYRWTRGKDLVTTLDRHSFFRSYRWGYWGVRFDFKQWMVGFQIWSSTVQDDWTLNIYPLPVINVVIHFRGREKTKCATPKTLLASTLRLSVA